MEAMTGLNKVTEAIERVLKGAAPVGTTKEMTPDALMTYAVEQIEKAAKEPPKRAQQRLRALSRTVDAAKQAFVDTESESVTVELFEEETTAAADESETETSIVAAGGALGNSAFAENTEKLNKTLARVAKDFKALQTNSGAKKEKPSADEIEKAADVAWPFDMNTPEFREGVNKADEEPAWGDDPKGLRAEEE